MACTEPLVIHMSGIKGAGMMPVMQDMEVGVVPEEDTNEARQ